MLNYDEDRKKSNDEKRLLRQKKQRDLISLKRQLEEIKDDQQQIKHLQAQLEEVRKEIDVLNSKENNLDYDQFDMYKCDIYSLGVVILQLMTIGVWEKRFNPKELTAKSFEGLLRGFTKGVRPGEALKPG